MSNLFYFVNIMKVYIIFTLYLNVNTIFSRAHVLKQNALAHPKKHSRDSSIKDNRTLDIVLFPGDAKVLDYDVVDEFPVKFLGDYDLDYPLRDVPLETKISNTDAFNPNILLLQMNTNQLPKKPPATPKPTSSSDVELLKALNMLIKMRDTVKSMMPNKPDDKNKSLSSAPPDPLPFQPPQQYLGATRYGSSHLQHEVPIQHNPYRSHIQNLQYPLNLFHQQRPTFPYYYNMHPCSSGASTSTSTSPGSAAAAASSGGCGGGSTSTSTSTARRSTGHKNYHNVAVNPNQSLSPVSSVNVIPVKGPREKDNVIPATTRRPFQFSIGRRTTSTTPSTLLSPEQYKHIMGALSSVMTILNDTRLEERTRTTKIGLGTSLGGIADLLQRN